MTNKISKNKLDCILDELNKSHESNHELIWALLKLTPRHGQVTFAYHCALDVKHLLTNKRSFAALESVKAYLDTGKPVPKVIIGAYTTAADTAVYTAADAASTIDTDFAAYAAANAAHNSVYCFPNREEKLIEYLNKLKELILEYVDEQDKSDILELCL